MKKSKKLIVIIISIIALFVMVLIAVGMFNARYDRIAYKTDSYEKKYKFTVNDILYEKDKEPVYELSIGLLDNVYVTESDFKKYVGEGTNILTVKHDRLDIYVAKAKFGTSFDKSHDLYLKKVSYPWEDQASKFSEEEIQEAVEIAKTIAHPLDYSPIHGWSTGQFSFDVNACDNFTYEQNCLNDGAIEVSLQ